MKGKLLKAIDSKSYSSEDRGGINFENAYSRLIEYDGNIIFYDASKCAFKIIEKSN